MNMSGLLMHISPATSTVRGRSEQPAPRKSAASRAIQWASIVSIYPRTSVIAAAILSFAIALAHGPAEKFVYDAAQYWAGAQALATGGNVFKAGGLGMRGALSAVVYLPATAVRLLTGASPYAVVLVQNALLVAWLGTMLIPRIAGLLVTTSKRHVWISAILSALLLAGFAPYPLLDLWAVALMLAGALLLLGRKSPWLLACGGLVIAVAINLRPAYIVPAALAGIVWMTFFWRKAHWPALGAAIAFAPQVITNMVVMGSWKPWPTLTSKIAAIQAQYAGYTIRYDTIAYVESPSPRQFFCSPELASTAGAQFPKGTGELVVFFANSFPESLSFMAQKVAASLSWSLATPYEAPPSGGIGLMAIAVATVSSVGFLALIWHFFRRQAGSRGPVIPVLLAVWLGSVATLVFATPETRFALPILLIGLIGCAVATSRVTSRLPMTVVAVAWGEGVAVLVVLLLWLGTAGLSHPAPPGDVTAAICRVS